MVLKVCPCVGASLYSLHVTNGFGGRAVSDVLTNHVFPQDGLAAVTLIGSGAGDGGARARAVCWLGLLLCSVANTTPLGVGVGP